MVKTLDEQYEWGNYHLAYLSLQVLHRCLKSFRIELSRDVLPVDHDFAQDGNTGFNIFWMKLFLEIKIKPVQLKHSCIWLQYKIKRGKTSHPLFEGLCILS
jgi:hypothetical protein